MAPFDVLDTNSITIPIGMAMQMLFMVGVYTITDPSYYDPVNKIKRKIKISHFLYHILQFLYFILKASVYYDRWQYELHHCHKAQAISFAIIWIGMYHI